MWQPSATIETLKQRAALMTRIRQFFAERGVLEVETPALSHHTITDVHLHPFEAAWLQADEAGQGIPLYLQTSPEFHMKRLLAAGSGPIFQLGRAFRNEEFGRHHNPEFTMLEWYRPGFDHFALMDEMDALLQCVLGGDSAERLTYQQAFMRYLGVDPLTATMAQLRAVAPESMRKWAAQEQDRDTLLQLLFAEGVETQIGQQVPCFVYNFPASQAALAKLVPEDPRVAARFEVYFKGLELANGFYELQDAAEQQARFEQDNLKRQQLGRPARAIDKHLIDALTSGLPDCAGVALGVDRLIMLALGADSIAEVLAFGADRA